MVNYYYLRATPVRRRRDVLSPYDFTCGFWCLHHPLYVFRGTLYIGSSVNIRKRVSWHFKKLHQNNHPNTKLQKVWNQQGADNFWAGLLEKVCRADLIKSEQFWIDIFDAASSLNISTKVAHSGSAHSAVTKTKLGFLSSNASESTREKRRQNALDQGRQNFLNLVQGKRHLIIQRKRRSTRRWFNYRTTQPILIS